MPLQPEPANNPNGRMMVDPPPIMRHLMRRMFDRVIAPDIRASGCKNQPKEHKLAEWAHRNAGSGRHWSYGIINAKLAPRDTGERQLVQAKAAVRKALKEDASVSDGRRARSHASRAKIIEAMMDLVAAGDPNPSAASVAQKAGVGLRSVFRHFEDKESILREMDRILVKAYKPILEASYKSNQWREQLDELIERRSRVSEEIFPFRISSNSARFRSKFVQENYRRLYEREKAMLDAILPPDLKTNTRAGRALLVAASFDTWRLLRQDENMSAREATIAIKELVHDIVERALG